MHCTGIVRNVPKCFVVVMVVAFACCRIGHAQAPITRDSAGVAIVENLAPRWIVRAPRRLDMTPALTLGTAGGGPEQQFGEVTDAVRLDNGDIVVADRKNYQLRIFDPAGHFIRTIGQRGEGPGDVQVLASIYPVGGNVILAWDQRASRLTWFGLDGTVRRTLNVDRPPEQVSHGDRIGFDLFVVGVLANGGVMAYHRSGRIDPPVGLDVDSIVMWHVDDTGRLHGATALRYGEPWLFRQGRLSIGDWRPFTTNSSVVGTPDGFWYTDGVEFEVRQYGADGVLRRVIRERRTPTPVMPAEVEAYKRAQIDEAKTEHLRDESSRAAIVSANESAMSWLPFPARHAAFTALKVDPAGGIWAREDGDSTAVEHWDHFDRAGHLLGEVDFPAGLMVFEIGTDYVLGKVQDQDGVDNVKLYRIAR